MMHGLTNFKILNTTFKCSVTLRHADCQIVTDVSKDRSVIHSRYIIEDMNLQQRRFDCHKLRLFNMATPWR